MPAPAISTSTVIDVMVDGYWAGGSSLALTYSVPTGASAWGAYGAGEEPSEAGFSVLDATQAAAFVTAMELWDSYVAASFTKTTEPGAPGAIRVAFTTDAAWGHAWLPAIGDSPAVNDINGDIWISDAQVGSDFAVGSYDFQALLHESGHALGLDHTFDGLPADILPVEYDNYRYSVMSYTDIGFYSVFAASGGGGITWAGIDVTAITPMLFDILVIQDLYGTSTTTRAGATTYTFDADTPSLQTIFDSGGVDTFDLTGHTRASDIDLRAASFSSIDYYPYLTQIEDTVAIFGEGFRAFITGILDEPDAFIWTDNVAIAYGVTIENVFCGDAADDVIGNSAANELRGNGGADTLYGAAGADKLNGGTGADTMVGGTGNDTYTVNTAGDVTTETSATGGADLVRSSVTRTLGANLENLTLTGSGAINGIGNSLANVLTGNGSANRLTGGAGGDTLKGGLGLDTLVGGGGSDKFVFNTAPATANRDTITDYNVAADTVHLDNAVFAALGAAGALAAGKFHLGSAAHDSDDRIIYNSTSGALYYDADGDGAGAKIQFATLGAGLALTAADFVVI